MPSIADMLRDAAAQLETVSETPRLDAELLMAHALDVDRGTLLLNHMQQATPHIFGALLLRRLAHEPVAYITGEAEFWSLPLQVTPDVLIPRNDSETLIAAATAHFRGKAPRHILDLGTGSGALLLAALSEWPQAQGLGLDRSAAALGIAKDNAARLQLADRAQFRRFDWTGADAWSTLDRHFDLILCNPPYVEEHAQLAPQVRDYEPHQALFAGSDGLDDYRRLIPELHRLLTDCGIAIFEIGATQSEAVGKIARESGFISHLRHDLAGHPRALLLVAHNDSSSL
ncbi:MAG: peptide chain release factor N(5)-glutamine methyltransferase [Pseudomonadota bacterium]